MTAEIIHGDCLDVMRGMPDASIDLVLTDPPYFRVKDEPWDRQWASAEAFLAWMGELCAEWRRILKPNGSLYVFAATHMARRVGNVVAEHFAILNEIRWRKPPYSTKAEMFRKEDLRAYFPASEHIIFAEQRGSDATADAEAGYTSQCEAAKRGVFGDYLRAEFRRAGVTNRQIAALFPSRTGGLTGCVSNWLLGYNCPTPEQYEQMRALLNGHGGEYLRENYEDLRRPFALTDTVPYTDVWDFPTVSHYPGKHPCEKPRAMLRHMIAASTRPGAIVFDGFAGSGATAEAALDTGRGFIVCDKSEHWADYARQRVTGAQAQTSLGVA